MEKNYIFSSDHKLNCSCLFHRRRVVLVDNSSGVETAIRRRESTRRRRLDSSVGGVGTLHAHRRHAWTSSGYVTT